jgi:hypothetical protein
MERRLIVATNYGRYAALHESAFGTFETCQLALRMSAYRGRPEVVRPMVGINAIDRSGIVLTRAQVALAGERA